MIIENAYYYATEFKKNTDTVPKEQKLFLLSTGRTKLITVPIAKTLHPPRKDYQLIYMHRGCLHYFDNDGTAHIAPQGSFVLYKPYEHQEFYITSEEEADKYWCHFGGLSVDTLLETYGLTDKRVIPLPPKKRYRQLFVLMRTALENNSEYKVNLCSLYVHELIATIGDALKSQNGQLSYPKSFAYTLDYINNNYYEKITIEKLVTLGTTNSKTLTRQFLKYTGVPPIKYLNNLRIEKSKILLLQTEHKINEIALAVGFQDPLYFSSVFHSATGLSPREYRNKL